MGEAANSNARPATITHKGVEYKIFPFDVDKTEMFELWLEEKAWNAVERQKHRISAEQYKERLDLVTEQIAAQKYAFGSPAFAAAAKSLSGYKYWTFLLLMENTGMTQDLAAEIVTDQLLLFSAKVQAMQSDPKASISEAETASENLTMEILSQLLKSGKFSVTNPFSSFQKESASSPSDKSDPFISASETTKDK